MKHTLIVFALLISSSVIAQDWVTYKNDEFNFSVDLPTEPETMDQKVPTEVGELTMNMFVVDQSGNTTANNLIYMVIHTDYPINQDILDDAGVQKMLDGSVDGAVANVRGKLVSVEKVVKDGFHGRKAKIEVQGAFIHMQMYLKEKTLYAIQAICMIEKDGNKNLEKFFSSFNFKD
ncbi:hypothetical protein [Lacinutrix chionoecetis]